MMDILNKWTNQVTLDTILIYGIGLGVIICVFMVYRQLIDYRTRADRMALVLHHRARLHGENLAFGRRKTALTGPSPVGLFKLWLRYVRSLRADQMEILRRRLVQAGLRSNTSVSLYVCAKTLLPVLLMTGSAAALYMVWPAVIVGMFRPAVVVMMSVAGFFGPDLLLHNAAAKRRIALQKSLPDGLDLLVICAEAGLSLDAALNRVAEEIAPSSPELAEELAITSVELNFLPERRIALENLAGRIGLPAVRGVVNTLVQTEKYGTPLSQSLRVLSAEFRDQRLLRAEEKAARLPATLTVPMILFILPTLFIVLVGPAMIDVYDHMTK